MADRGGTVMTAAAVTVIAAGINNSIVTEDVGKKISGLESEQ